MGKLRRPSTTEKRTKRRRESQINLEKLDARIGSAESFLEHEHHGEVEERFSTRGETYRWDLGVCNFVLFVLWWFFLVFWVWGCLCLVWFLGLIIGVFIVVEFVFFFYLFVGLFFIYVFVLSCFFWYGGCSVVIVFLLVDLPREVGHPFRNTQAEPAPPDHLPDLGEANKNHSRRPRA